MLFSIAVAACGSGGGSSATSTYSISGIVTGASSVTLNLTGTSTASTTTDVSGNYSFAGLANGSYTVTPSLTGYAFSPTGTAVTVSGANVTGTNFVGTVAATTYSISGAVSGATSADVTITLGGDNTGSTLTVVGGTYTIAGLVAGNYTVTPSKAGYTFSPTNIAITGLAANSTANDFVATAIPLPHSISGAVSGATSSGVTIDVTGSATASATTAANGSYTVTGLYDGSYTVTPSKTGYTFTPNSTSVTMSGADMTGKNFTSTVYTAPTYTLSGAVTGPYVEGVTIAMSGAGSATTTTNASGNYSFANLPAGTYTLTPSLAGYTYSPSAPAVAIVNANKTQNLVASSAITSYSISGTVSYPVGTNSGPIGIRIYQSSCTGCNSMGGTVISAPGAYTVRGLQPGSYVVAAEMDTLGTGTPNANNPLGVSATATVVAANLPGVNVVVADSATPTAVTPTIQGIFPANSSAFIMYSPPKDANNQEIATSYKIYYGTTSAASDGVKTFTAQGDNQNFYVLSGLTDANALYVKISAKVGNLESALSAASGPVAVGAVTGAHTVSGKVTFLGAATGPMVVGVFSNGGIYFTYISSPVSPQIYSISGVASGSYQVFSVIDMDNNGVAGIGDISNTSGNGSATTITVSSNTTSNLTLSSASATATVNTDHWYDGVNHNYSLNLGINDGIKHAVAVTLASGPNVAVPFDMGIDPNNTMNLSLNTTVPTVGDAYMFKVTYSDGTTQNLSGSVTGVLGMNAFAQTLAVVTDGTGGSSATVPLFTWAAPTTPPASYTYHLNLWGNSDSTNWYFPRDNGMPSTTLSALYNSDGNASNPTLTTGNAYNWQIQVRDANRNGATRQAAVYTP